MAVDRETNADSEKLKRLSAEELKRLRDTPEAFPLEVVEPDTRRMADQSAYLASALFERVPMTREVAVMRRRGSGEPFDLHVSIPSGSERPIANLEIAFEAGELVIRFGQSACEIENEAGVDARLDASSDPEHLAAVARIAVEAVESILDDRLRDRHTFSTGGRIIPRQLELDRLLDSI